MVLQTELCGGMVLCRIRLMMKVATFNVNSPRNGFRSSRQWLKPSARRPWPAGNQSSRQRISLLRPRDVGYEITFRGMRGLQWRRCTQSDEA